MPAAADAPVKKLAGSGQNIAGTAETPICAKQSNAITITGLETSPDKPIPIARHQKRVGDMAFSLHRLVGMPAEQNHANTAENKRQRGQQSGLSVAYAKAFDDSRQEEGNAVARCIQTKINQSAEQD